MPNRPNVIIVMTDQQRADLSRREGFPLDTTPYMDALTAQGTWFDRAYTSMPVCGPARISMLTGRYPSATRVRTNHNIPDAYYSEDLFDLFRANGYKAALVGKNHSHLTPQKADFWYEAGHLGIDGDKDRTPEEKAFDDWLKTTHFHTAKEPPRISGRECNSLPNGESVLGSELDSDPNTLGVECQIPYRLVSKAQEWIGSQGENPFLLWLSFPEPHNPYQCPEPYWSMFPPESLPKPAAGEEALAAKGFPYQWCRQSFIKAFPDFVEQTPRMRSTYLGMLRMIDDQVKRLVQFLGDRGLRDNTILIILSDHGDFVGEYGLMRKGPELPEPLVRIPMQITGPGIRKSVKPQDAHVSIVDIMPTLCEAVGLPTPDGVQGRSLWPILTGGDYPREEFASAYVEHGFGGLHYTEHEDLDPARDGLTSAQSEIRNLKSEMVWGGYDCLNSWTQSGQMRMIRKGDWKLVYDMQGAGQLYDLGRYPGEVTNLYGKPECSGKQTELLEDLLMWRLRMEDPLPLPRTRYVMKRPPHGYWEE